MHRRQAEFYQQATDRAAILRTALSPTSGPWQQGAALDFASALPEDNASLLPELMVWALSHNWIRAAQDAIDRIPRNRLMPLLEPLFLAYLAEAQDDDYGYLASLTARLEAWSLLERLVHQAEENSNPEVREIALYYTEFYGPMWTTRLTPPEPNP